MKCHAELKVPVDPHTPGVFDGEEFNRAARFWTHGYDVYTPHRVYVLHDYPGSQHNPKTMGWGHGKFDSGAVRNGYFRLNTMLDVPGGETDPAKAREMKQSRYGLGDRRSLDDLIQFSGIDLRHKKPTVDGVNRCGNIQWVPFTEHPKGVNHIPKFDDQERPLDLPYDKTSVWYDPAVDGAGAGLVDRPHSKEKEKDPAEAERRRAEEEAAHESHKKEAQELASGGSLADHHAKLARAIAKEEDPGAHREVVSGAAAAAAKAEREGRGEAAIFPPLPPPDSAVPRGRFFFSRITMNKHGA